MKPFSVTALLFLLATAPLAFAGDACDACDCCRDACCPVPAETEVVVAVHAAPDAMVVAALPGPSRG